MTAANTDTQNLESSKPTDNELSETQLDDVAGGGIKGRFEKAFSTKKPKNSDGTQKDWVQNASLNAAQG